MVLLLADAALQELGCLEMWLTKTASPVLDFLKSKISTFGGWVAHFSVLRFLCGMARIPENANLK